MKAEELIRDSLQEIGIQAAEQSIKPDIMQTGIRYMNRMFRGVDYLGLGYSVVDSASDEVTIPAYAEEWAVFKLAIRLSSQFPPNDQLMAIMANEKEAWVNLLAQHQELESTKFSGAVPVGSGNNSGMWGATFYPEQANGVLNESGDYILLEE